MKGEALPPILYTDLRGSPYFPSKFNQNVLLYSLFTCNNCHHAFVLQDFYTFCYLDGHLDGLYLRNHDFSGETKNWLEP